METKEKETNSGVMKGYKGFNEKLQCTPGGKVFQYEIGGSYEEPNADLCKNGFHFCENPLDVFIIMPQVVADFVKL